MEAYENTVSLACLKNWVNDLQYTHGALAILFRWRAWSVQGIQNVDKAASHWWWRWRRNVSFSISASLSLFSALTLYSHAHLWSIKLSLKMRVSSNELFSTLKQLHTLIMSLNMGHFLPFSIPVNKRHNNHPALQAQLEKVTATSLAALAIIRARSSFSRAQPAHVFLRSCLVYPLPRAPIFFPTQNDSKKPGLIWHCGFKARG